MPDLFIPNQDLDDKIKGLVNGFFIEKDEDDMPVIIIKLEPSILNELISGCPFEFIIRNPKLSKRSVTLYIYDNEKDPLWITYNNFSDEDPKYINFDVNVINFILSDEFRIAYYNHLNLPIFTRLLSKKNMLIEFNNWIMNIYSNCNEFENVNDGYFMPEDDVKGFKISIENKDDSNSEKINIYSYSEIANSENEEGLFFYNFNDYQKNGLHGYDQENNVQYFLSNFFQENIEIFSSLKDNRNHEVSDFIIMDHNAVVLIESKAIKSNKSSKLSQAVVKAINQLNRAEAIFMNKNIETDNIYFKENYTKCEIIIKVCLVNDRMTTHLLQSGNYIKNFKREELPIFISVTTLFQLLADFKINFKGELKFNLIQNLINNRINHLENTNEDYLLIREYKKGDLY